MHKLEDMLNNPDDSDIGWSWCKITGSKKENISFCK